MNLCVIVLREEELYAELMHQFREKNITNITVIESVSLRKEKKRHKKAAPIFSSLRYMMDYVDDDSYQIEIVGTEEEVKEAQKITKELVPVRAYFSYIIPLRDVEGTLS